MRRFLTATAIAVAAIVVLSLLGLPIGLAHGVELTADVAAGRTPAAVVATVGTTGTALRRGGRARHSRRRGGRSRPR